MDLQNTQNPANPRPGNVASVNPRPGTTASDLSANAAEQADKAIAATMRATDGAAQSVHAGLQSLQDKVPGMLSHAGATADEYIALGAQRAREASNVVRESTGHAQERAVVYIREKPLKSVLIAAGVGAVVALLLSGRSRH